MLPSSKNSDVGIGARSIYRNRTASGGGVLIATKTGIIADEVSLQVSSSQGLSLIHVLADSLTYVRTCITYRRKAIVGSMNLFVVILLNERNFIVKCYYEHYCLSTYTFYCILGYRIVNMDALKVKIKITVTRRSLKYT